MQVEDKRLGTGVAGFDEILNGGLPEHYFYLLEGDPGAGKTTLALQFLFEGVKRGESVLYVTLSETRKELEAVARSHGWNLNTIPIYELFAERGALSPTITIPSFIRRTSSWLIQRKPS